MRVACGRGSILFWRQCNQLYTSGFVDDVMFAHNRPAKSMRIECILRVSNWGTVPDGGEVYSLQLTYSSCAEAATNVQSQQDNRISRCFPSAQLSMSTCWFLAISAILCRLSGPFNCPEDWEDAAEVGRKTVKDWGKRAKSSCVTKMHTHALRTCLIAHTQNQIDVFQLFSNVKLRNVYKWIRNV